MQVGKESVIKLIPKNNAPNPNTIAAILLTNGLFTNVMIAAPTKIIIGAIAVSFNETNCDVIDVPILAPSVSPTDFSSVKSPEFTLL